MRRRRALRALEERRRELFHAMVQPDVHPHTQGMWEALGYAIEMLERHQRCRARVAGRFSERCQLPTDHGTAHLHRDSSGVPRRWL